MVRVWCVPVRLLDRQHLLGEHAELHVMYNAIVKAKLGIQSGWQKHPQTLRFMDRLGMLVDRHRQQAKELLKRGYRHNSPLPETHVLEPYKYSNSEMESDLKTLRERVK